MGKKVTQGGCGGGGSPPGPEIRPRVLQQQQNLLIINYTKTTIFSFRLGGRVFLTLLGLTPPLLNNNINNNYY